ncbi:MAG: hypothetical protein WCT03_20240 [Candidatus Obscuribacterales bacterium]|jgi:hypothetical protein
MIFDSYASGSVLIFTVSLLSVLGLLVVRKFFDLEKLESCHEVGGYLLSVVGTMYAVLLGLIVVDAMTKFQTAREIVEQEANSLADVFLLANSMPPEKCRKVQIVCNEYVKEILEVEWPAMAEGKISKTARKAIVELMKEVMSFEPVTENQKAIYPIAVQEACQVWDFRRARTNMAQHGIPAVEWIVLVIGAVVTIVFTYFFGLSNAKAQMAMTGMVSLLISLNMYLVILFGTPFSGDLQVSPDAFRVDKLIFDNQLGYRPDAETPKL